MLKQIIRYCMFLGVSLVFTVNVHAEKGMMASKEMLSQTCVGCHGPNGASMGPATPSIGGQPKNYLISVLLGYKYHSEPDMLDKLMEQKKFEDFEMFPRYSIIMSRLMAGYTLEEIEQIAEYFSEQKWQSADQDTKYFKVRSGAKLHEATCEKCHEEGGTSDVDDISILAGQWMPYLENTLSDYWEKRSKMPKKMKQKLEQAHEEVGDSAFEKLINYYGSQ